MCDCPQDWVCCFKQTCERAAAIKERQREWYEKYKDVIGDLAKSVNA